MNGNNEYENLVAEMARAGISFRVMADRIGMSPSTIYIKRSGSGDWKLAEMTAIQNVLQIETGLDLPLDYLFKRKNDQEGE